MSDLEKAAYAKVTWRLVPFLFLCYILAFVDRVNVSFAKLQMQHDLGMSDTVFGIGMGIFFVGYFIFEVPGNVILQKVGARLWIGPIMVVWGLVSSLTMLVTDATLFYALRFVLGVVESGFFPGVVLYLTFWYTRRHRVRVVAAFMSAIALAGAFGSPLSGWIMSRMTGRAGLTGWQWLFLLEGLPSVAVGLVALRFLDDGPRTAKWLTPKEREILIARLDEEERMKAQAGVSGHRLVDAFRSGRVWLLCVVYFGLVMALYGVTFWLPQIIEDGFTRDPWRIGLISVIPWGVGALGMVLWGHHSDARGERRWHLAAAGTLAGVFYVVSGVPGLPAPMVVAALTLTTVGILSGLSTFWALPTSLLSGTAAAAGIAWINSVGNLGGYVSPHVVGFIRDRSGEDMLPALVVLSVACFVSVVVVLGMTRDRPCPHS